MKKWIILLLLVVGAFIATVTYNNISKSNALEGQVKNSFLSLDSKKYFASLDLLKEQSMSSAKFLKENQFEVPDFHARLIARLKHEKLQYKASERLSGFLKEAGERYDVPEKDIPIYIDLIGESEVVHLIEKKQLSKELLSNEILSNSAKYAKSEYPAFVNFYSDEYKELKSQITHPKYPRIHGRIVGRLSVDSGEGGNQAAIIQTPRGKVAVLYWHISRDNAIRAAQMKDTYQEQQAALIKLTEALESSPQNQNYYNQIAVRTTKTLSTNDHTYDVYRYCSKFNKEDCVQYCDAQGECGDIDSYDSHMAKVEIEKLQPIFSQYEIR